MPADTIVTYDTMAYWVCIPWDNKGGRATLVGDATHHMTPCKSSFPLRELHLTDALACRSGTGIEPCNQRQCQLRRCTTKGPDRGSQLEEAISAYDDEVVKRGADEVVSSKQSTLTILNWDQFMNSPVMKAGLN